MIPREDDAAIGQARRAVRDARVKHESAVRNGYSDVEDRRVAYEQARLRLDVLVHSGSTPSGGSS